MTASLRRKTRFTLAVGMRLCLVCMSAQILLPHRTTAQVNADTEEWVSKGESLLAQEKRQPTLRADRVAAFGEAARRLAQQLPSIPETSGVYPVFLFRIGLYLYLSDASADAQVILSECQRHPQLGSTTAVWKGQAIASHLRSFSGVRISAASDSGDEPSRTEGSVPEGGMRLWAHSSKGGIRTARRPEPETPFSTEEKSKLMSRIGPTRFPQSAQALAVKLLTPLGRPPVSAIQGQVLIATLGKQEDAARVAEQLSANQKRLWTELLGRSDKPPLVVVYANLDTDYSEESARALSLAVHGRPSAEREGYYSPLDHSVVLRKGILDDNGKLYLGTAAHELAHALIDSDAPQTPHWLNEGIASLFEEQNEQGQPIDNYRLYELLVEQKATPTLSLSSLFSDKPPGNPRLRDALSRYVALWMFGSGEKNALQKVYTTFRSSPSKPAGPVVSAAMGVTVAELDEKFGAFLRSRNVHEVDARWGDIKPRELQPPSAPSRGSGPMMQQRQGPGPMMQQSTNSRNFPGQVAR